MSAFSKVLPFAYLLVRTWWRWNSRSSSPWFQYSSVKRRLLALRTRQDRGLTRTHGTRGPGSGLRPAGTSDVTEDGVFLCGRWAAQVYLKIRCSIGFNLLPLTAGSTFKPNFGQKTKKIYISATSRDWNHFALAKKPPISVYPMRNVCSWMTAYFSPVSIAI